MRDTTGREALRGSYVYSKGYGVTIFAWVPRQSSVTLLSRLCTGAKQTIDGYTHTAPVRVPDQSEPSSRDFPGLCAYTRFDAATQAQRAMTSMLGFHDSQALHVFGPRAGMHRSWTNLASHVSRPLTHVTHTCRRVRSVCSNRLLSFELVTCAASERWLLSTLICCCRGNRWVCCSSVGESRECHGPCLRQHRVHLQAWVKADTLCYDRCLLN